MFNAYYSQIEIKRQEPENLDVEKSTKEIKVMFERMADHIVSKSLLVAPKDDRKKKGIETKIRKMIETEQRLKSVKGFVELWNRWREYYFSLPPIFPKNNSQIGAIEGAIKFANDHDMNLSILIACIHHAYLKRTIRPNYTSVIAYGEEWYEKFYDKVVADVSRSDYIERAER